MMTQTFIEKTLSLILTFVVVTIVSVTVITFTTSRDSIGQSFRRADPTPRQVVKSSAKTSTRQETYTEIGEIRTFTKAPSDNSRGSTLLITPWFSYATDDHALYEELSQKNRQFRSQISEYFTKHTYLELKSMGEDEIKAEIERMINNQLVLGKISAVYFEEYIFFE